jgi:RTX calcium-binding nonapeptide repeat (4 copies)/Calcineurin-like phosphoesterase
MMQLGRGSNRAWLWPAGLAALLLFVLAPGAQARSRCTIAGTAGNDRLVGSPRADVICAGAGADTIIAGGGNDLVYGGGGNDVIYPGTGADRVLAGPGSDLIFSRDARPDLVDGGAGLDRARPDPGLDRPIALERLFPASPAADPVVLAAGDIADCSRFGARLTAPLLDAFPYARVLTLGDTTYPRGASAEFERCYAPTWGRAKARTRPTVGNHEYGSAGAAGYFRYFGKAAGEPGRGWYSFDLGAWHLVSLNSNCAEIIGGCAPGSPQERWLRADLASHPRACTLAYWHHPLFSSGPNGGTAAVAPLWQALAEAGADLVLVGHEHGYERFAPQSPTGAPDPAGGMRQIVVGTGGVEHTSFARALPASEVREGSSYGLLRLTLAPSAYSWEFVPEAGKTFTDSGSAACH